MENDGFGYMAMGQDVHDDGNRDNQPPTNANGSDQPNTDRNDRIMANTGATNHMVKERHAFSRISNLDRPIWIRGPSRHTRDTGYVRECGDVEISILDSSNQIQKILLTDVLVSPFLGDIDIISINKLLQSIARLITFNENCMTISLSTNETTTINIPPYNNAYLIPLRMLPILIVVEELQEPKELLRAEAPLANANYCPDLLSVGSTTSDNDPLLPLPADEQREGDARRARLRSLLTTFDSGASTHYEPDVRNAFFHGPPHHNDIADQ
jgi:hypothetical protein